MLEQIRKDTGIKVRPTYMGTLDAVNLLAKGRAKDAYDALWLSSNDYLRLNPTPRSRSCRETPVMSSPVAIGVKNATVRKLGWKPENVTWADIEEAVADGEPDVRHDRPVPLQLRFLHPRLGGLGPLRRPVRAHGRATCSRRRPGWRSSSRGRS